MSAQNVCQLKSPRDDSNSHPQGLSPNPTLIDEAEVRRFLGLIVDPNSLVQIQSLPSAEWRAVPGHDLDGLVAAVSALADGKGTYATLNPIEGSPRTMAKNEHMAQRRWLLLDIDAIKADRDASTTEEEKAAALQMAKDIAWHLRCLGWPDPLLVDSGNNWQLLYRVDLPHNKESDRLVRAVLKVLGKLFDTDQVKVDPAVSDARRISKIAGTWTRKGENTAERPWRMARIAWEPETLTPVPVARLQALAGTPARDGQAERRAVNPARIWRMTPGPNHAYGRKAREDELAKLATCSQNRNTALYQAALKLGSLCAADLLDVDKATARAQLAAVAETIGLGQDGDRDEIARAIDNAWEAGSAKPRASLPSHPGAPSRDGHSPSGADPAAELSDWSQVSDEDLGLKPLRSYPMKSTDWAWKHRLARRELNLFAGEGGVGKSTAIQRIVAAITVGGVWPDGSGARAPKGRVVYLSAEDDPSTVIRPRIVAMNGNDDMVTMLRAEYVRVDAKTGKRVVMPQSLQNRAYFREVLGRVKGAVCFVVDPLPGYLRRNVNDSKNNELRSVLDPIIDEVIRDLNLIFIGNTHLNKAVDLKNPLHRINGSVAYTNIPRTTHIFARDDQDPKRRLMMLYKNNLAPDDLPTLAYRIVGAEVVGEGGEMVATSQAVFEDAPIELSRAEQADAVAGGHGRGDRAKRERLIAWLRGQLAEGPVESDEIKRRAGEDGFGKHMLWEVKDKAGVKAHKDGFTGRWYWSLGPAEAP
jgi:hypothetical protein